LNTVGSVLGQSGHLDTAIPCFAEAKELAEAVRDATELGRYYHNLAGSLAEAGRAAEARQLRLEGIGVLASYGLERSTAVTVALALAGDECWGGDPREAHRLLMLIFDQGVPSRDAVSAQALLGQTEMLLGDHAAADAAFARGREIAGRHARDDIVADLACAEAENAAWQGLTSKARASVGEAMRLQTRAHYDARVMALALAVRIEADAAEVARAAHDGPSEAIARETAHAYAARALHLASTAFADGAKWGNVGDAEAAMCEPEVARANGRSSPDAWADAMGRVQDLAMPAFEAYALWRWAEALARSPASRADLEALIRRGLGVSSGTHEPIRRELVRLARTLGMWVPVHGRKAPEIDIADRDALYDLMDAES
jgi:hypothetical protein